MIIKNEIRTGYKTNSFQGKFTGKNISKRKITLLQIRSYFQLSAISFYFLKKKIKRMPLLSGLGEFNKKPHQFDQ
jgi:hypothetical protein